MFGLTLFSSDERRKSMYVETGSSCLEIDFWISECYFGSTDLLSRALGSNSSTSIIPELYLIVNNGVDFSIIEVTGRCHTW